jgi:hypothetical protein
MASDQTPHTTPPKYAKKLGVSPEKVIHFIESGELVAVNLATKSNGSKRWRISAEAIADFERRRSAVPSTASPRRTRRAVAGVREYF